MTSGASKARRCATCGLRAKSAEHPQAKAITSEWYRMDSANAPQGNRLATKTSGQKGAGAEVVATAGGRRRSRESARLRRKLRPQGSSSTRRFGARRDRGSGLDWMVVGMFSSPKNELIDHFGAG